MKYTEIARRVLSGEREFLYNIGNKNRSSPGRQIPFACGRLRLEPLAGVQPHGYMQTLDLSIAECKVVATPTRAGHTWGINPSPVELKIRVQADENIVCIELSCDTRQHMRFYLDRPESCLHPSPSFCCIDQDGFAAAQMSNIIHDGNGYVSTLIGRSDSLQMDHSRFGIQGDITYGGELGPARLLVAMVSKVSVDPGYNIEEKCLALAVQALRSSPDQLRFRHETWWSQFWSQSDIYVSDPILQEQWELGLYVLGSSTRPNASPPHLQGIWNQDELPPWHSDFHFNTNVQACHWLAGMANHPELEAALVRVLSQDWREELRHYCTECFGVDGLAVPLNTDWSGKAIGGWPLAGDLCITAWVAQHLWRYWLYTGDKDTLERCIYPWLMEAATFYLGILHEDSDGLFHFAVTGSPEQSGISPIGDRRHIHGQDATIDISCVQFLFDVLLIAAREIGEVNSELLRKWEHVRNHLPPLPQENGVWIDMALGYFGDGDRSGAFPRCHRHPSRLMPVWPAAQVGLGSSPEHLDLGRRSFDEFRQYGDSAFSGWSYGYQACIAACLGMDNDLVDLLHTLHRDFRLSGGLMSHNRLAPHPDDPQALYGPLMQVDALLAAAAAVNLALVHEAQGVIYLFPGIPAPIDARFRQLRLPRGVLISAQRKNGQVSKIEISCENDCNLCIANPWENTPMGIFKPNGDIDDVLEGDNVCWSMQAGQSVVCRAAKAQ